MKPILKLTVILLSLFLAACPSSATQVTADTSVGGKQATEEMDKKVVELGDKCSVDFACRYEDGTLMITTQESVARDPNVSKTDLFFELKEYTPISLLAGIDAVDSDPKNADQTLSVLNKKLAEAILGMELNTPAPLTISSDKVPRNDGNGGEVRLKLLRERSLVREMPLEYFKRFSKGAEPALGMRITLEPPSSNWEEPGGLMGEVIAIEGETVKVQHAVEPGDTFKTPFGPATVERLRDDNMLEIRLHPQKGQVLRIGGVLARVTEIDESAFTVDTDYVFGGQTLQCEAVVHSADKDNPESKAALDTLKIQVMSDMKMELAEARSKSVQPDPGMVQSGDLVWVSYKIIDQNGKLWQTNLSDENEGDRPAQDGTTAVSQTYPLVAGRPADIPGLNTAVMGMRKGEHKTLTLPPEIGYGPKDEKRVEALDRKHQMSLITTLTEEQFKQQFNTQPEAGAQIDLGPFGHYTVDKVAAQEVTLTLVPSAEPVEQGYGTTQAEVVDEYVNYTLIPKIGAPFEIQGHSGIIVGSDDEKFKVDFNHPLAGQTITVDFTVEDLRKAADLADSTIHWIEDLDQAHATARNEKKNVALMLYADWCGWCKKMFSETLTDPIITTMGEEFVWVKLNSDKEQAYKSMFQQGGFPTIVLLDTEGRVIEKREGFQTAHGLYKVLQNALVGKKS